MPDSGRDTEYDLDILSQQPNPVFTQICFFFLMPNDGAKGQVVEKLQQGLCHLAENFPWTAGQVAKDANASGNLNVKPFDSTPQLVIKDLPDGPHFSMEELRNTGFPVGPLDESLLCPLPTRCGELKTWPVFAVQATFIPGGLILSFEAQHNVADMLGLAELIRWTPKACREEEFSEEELARGNVDRKKVVSLFDDEWKPDVGVLALFTAKPPPGSNAAAPSIPPLSMPGCAWANFAFSATALKAIKDLAGRNLAEGSFVSTDDALSAFIWQRITCARLPRLDPAVKTKLARTVDLRRYFHVDPLYPGNLASRTYLTYTAQELADTPLGTIASQLRAQVDPAKSSLANDMRAYATLLSRTEDKSKLTLKVPLDGSIDVNLSSWAKFSDLYALDFGLGLGKPESIRRPQFTPDKSEGILYLLPRAPKGEIVVVMCLRNEDTERLMADREWTQFGRYIG
jgi:trichothecene 3-O-acetyltransferase